MLPAGRDPLSRVSTTISGVRASDQNQPRIHVRRSVQEFATGSDIADDLSRDTGILPNDNQIRTSRSFVHAQRSTDPGGRPTRLSRLSEAQEDRDDVERSETTITHQHGDFPNSGGARARQNRSSLSARPSFVGESSGLQRQVGFEQDTINLGRRILPPPSYRTTPSTSGNSKRAV